MTPLNRRLAALRRRLYRIVISRGASLALSVLLASIILAGLLDWQLQLPSVLRALLLVGMLTAAGCVAYRYLFVPLLVRTDNLSLALRVEECYPELNDALASTVQFLQQSAETRTATGSPTLRREAARQAMKLADKCDFRKAVSSHGVGWTLLGCLALAVAAGYLCYQAPALASTALWRLFEPFGGHTWTVLVLEDCPTRVAVGQPYVVRGTLGGIIPASARIELASISESERVVPIKTDKEKKSASLVAGLDMTQHKGSFRFRVRAGDATFPDNGGWHEVAVVPPPEWVSLDGFPSPQIELRYPDYTELPSPARLTPGTRRIEATEGTLVRLMAATDRPIERAWIEHRPENAGLRLAAFLGPLAAGSNLQAATSWHAGQAVWGQFPAVLSRGGKALTIDFLPRASGAYVVFLQDKEKLLNAYESDLRVQLDPIPIVQMERPASSQDVLPTASITLQVRVHDEQFAVRSAFLEYRRRAANGKWLDATPQRLPLYDHQMLHLPAPLGLGVALPIRLRLQRVDLETIWSLDGIATEGETIVIAACADDFNNVVSKPAGRSGEVELRVVGVRQLANIHDERMGEIHQELLRLQRLQDEALEAVKEVQQNLGKDERKNTDQLAEAGQQQKQIRERVGGNDEEGVRAAVKRLQQSLKDNNLPPSSTRDRLKKLAAELERIAEEDLQQIEPNLEEARKDIGSGKSPEKNAALDKAENLQQDAKKSIDELVKFLDPWASIHVVKGQARELLKEQRHLKNETEKLVPLKDENPGQALNESARAAETQKNLAERAEGLIKKMNEAAAGRKEKGEEHTAKLLEEAARIAEEALLPQTMREAKTNLERNEPFKAIDKQQESIQQLEKVIAALEERRDDEIARLMKKHSEAKKKVDELIDRLEKKRQAANSKEDRAGLEQLEKEVNEASRELAQLHADKAAKALERAAENLKRALRQLEEKQDAKEAEQEAAKELENAAQKLAEAEEQLAREQLARIADQIKTLKERQDAATAESKRLHEQSVEKLQRWTTPLRRSLADLRGTQAELRDEAEKLRSKIEGAKVFEHIMKQAGRSMDEAATQIDERVEKGGLRTRAMDPEEIDDENDMQAKTLELQEQASRRLQRLLDALKDAPPQLAKKDDKSPDKKGPDEGNMNEQGGAPGDNIPEIAQLKALRDEQRDLNDRTRQLAERQRTARIVLGGIAGAMVSLPPTGETEIEALRRLQEEQAELHQLFIEIAATQQQQ